MPASFKVIRHVRPKLSCTKLRSHRAGRSAEPTDRARPGRAGTAGARSGREVLRSSSAVSPERDLCAQGVELERSTLADWVGGSTRLLQPLVEALRRYVTAASKLHADDTPVPVLAPGKGKTKTGRLWTYVRDDRPAGDTASPAVWFAYSPDRKGEHPAQHLETFRGTLQADAYAGFNQLYENGRIERSRVLGACAAQVLRLWNKRTLRRWHGEALQRIADAVCGSKNRFAASRRTSAATCARTQTQPLLDSLRQWFEATLSKLSRKSETTVAIRYALSRWDALTRYIDDGHIEIDNNAAERSLRAVALGRKNYLFAGSDMRRRARRRHLQPDRYGQTQRPRSRSLSARSAHPHRRSSDQPHRRTAALEPQIHTCASVHLTYSWTVNKTVLFGRLRLWAGGASL